MGIKQGCPLSPTLFGLCISKLEEIVNRVKQKNKLDIPKLMHQFVSLLLHADDMILRVCNAYLEFWRHFVKVMDLS